MPPPPLKPFHGLRLRRRGNTATTPGMKAVEECARTWRRNSRGGALWLRVVRRLELLEAVTKVFC
ncbi:hypothetical protein V6Z11_D07G263100 [Gossypium hirsutum]